MSAHIKITRVAFSVTNCICFDQRVLKMAGTVSALNCDITIIGRTRGECCKSEKVPFRTHRFNMLFKRGFLFYKFFNIRLFFYLLFRRFDLLVANDLDTLLPNFLVSKIKGLPLVYDSHEYFTGVPEIQNRHFVRWVWKTIESFVFPKLTNVITVSDSIALQYENEYGLRPLTVRNCSLKANHISPFTRHELGVEADHLLLIMQGTGINIDRGGEELIEALNMTENVTLLIVGSGDIFIQLQKRIAELRLENKVKLIGRVPWNELMRYTKSADIGLTLDKNNNANHNYSLPNKLFDYINAGIPILAGDLPEIRTIILKYRCGFIIKEVTPFEISSAIIELRNNPALLTELRRNAVEASQELNWGVESVKVKAMYKNILKNI
jgi:glycosyltransferase involved in cell wall biosynthesis